MKEKADNQEYRRQVQGGSEVQWVTSQVWVSESILDRCFKEARMVEHMVWSEVVWDVADGSLCAKGVELSSRGHYWFKLKYCDHKEPNASRITYDDVEILSRVQNGLSFDAEVFSVLSELDRVIAEMDGVRKYNSRMNIRRQRRPLLTGVFRDWKQGQSGQTLCDVLVSAGLSRWACTDVTQVRYDTYGVQPYVDGMNQTWEAYGLLKSMLLQGKRQETQCLFYCVAETKSLPKANNQQRGTGNIP